MIANKFLLLVGSHQCVDENDAPNGVLLHLLQPPLPLVCRPMPSTTTNAFATALILPADGSNVATDRDALVVGPNGNEETPNGNGALTDCYTSYVTINCMKRDKHFGWI